MGFGLNPDSTSSGIPGLEGQPHRDALRSKGALDMQKEGLNTWATFGSGSRRGLELSLTQRGPPLAILTQRQQGTEPMWVSRVS